MSENKIVSFLRRFWRKCTAICSICTSCTLDGGSSRYGSEEVERTCRSSKWLCIYTKSDVRNLLFCFHSFTLCYIFMIYFVFFISWPVFLHNCFHFIYLFCLLSLYTPILLDVLILISTTTIYHYNILRPWTHLTNFMLKKVINLQFMRIRSKLISMNNFLFHKFFIFSSTSSDLVIPASVWSWRRNFPKRLLLSKNRIDWFIMVRTST